MRPYMIAIAGPSCSGKSTLARAIAAAVPSTIFSLDDYYRELHGLSYDERCDFNFDHPDALDSALLFEHLRALAEGKTIERPVYHFATHSRRREVVPMGAAEHLIVEGLF